ncbi:hypothetical protein [Flavobacterium sp. UBA7682]|nr:hypothetical protein [Flavobacterium sp. UBA7682]
MKGFVEFIIVSINEVEIELLIGLKEENNIEFNSAIEELIATIET